MSFWIVPPLFSLKVYWIYSLSLIVNTTSMLRSILNVLFKITIIYFKDGLLPAVATGALQFQQT